MRWFDRDFALGGLSDSEWTRRLREYAAHIEEIQALLRAGADELVNAVHLHDGQVAEWRYSENETLMLRVLTGDLQRRYEWTTLRYSTASLIGATVDDLQLWCPSPDGQVSEIIDDEIDIAPDGRFEHRMLLSPQGEFGVRFDALAIERRPASSDERRFE
jgi:hypothetical protein